MMLEMRKIDAAMDGTTMIYSGGFALRRDQVGLASELSRAMADSIGGYSAEIFSHKIFYNLLCIPIFNFLISVMLWRGVLPVALPYVVVRVVYFLTT